MSEIRDFKLSEISDLIILAFYELYKSGFYEGNRIEPKLDFEPIASAYEAEKAIELLISKRLLGSVDNHRAAMIAATRLRFAA